MGKYRVVGPLVLVVAHFVLMFPLQCQADGLDIPAVLGDDMVLQSSDPPAQLWGNASSGGAVDITGEGLVGSPYRTTADESGRWSITLKQQPIDGRQINLTISSVGRKIILQRVLFGAVFLCGGQSNSKYLVGC